MLRARLVKFPEDESAIRYGLFREAVRLSALDSKPLNYGGDWPKERINLAATGRQSYMSWYNPVADGFDAMAREIDKTMHDPTARERVRELAFCGDEMHDFYSGELRAGRVPYLPPHMGNKYDNCLAAWERLRMRMPTLNHLEVVK
jgi:hypothetical protein